MQTNVMKDAKAFHHQTNEKVWFRAVDSFLDPEYSVLRYYFPTDYVDLGKGMPCLTGAAKSGDHWILGYLCPDEVFMPL